MCDGVQGGALTEESNILNLTKNDLKAHLKHYFYHRAVPDVIEITGFTVYKQYRMEARGMIAIVMCIL